MPDPRFEEGEEQRDTEKNSTAQRETSIRSKNDTRSSDSVIVQAPSCPGSVKSNDFASTRGANSHLHDNSELSDSSKSPSQGQGHGFRDIGSQFAVSASEVDQTLSSIAECSGSQLGFCPYHSRALEESCVLQTRMALRHHDTAAHWIHSDSECWLAKIHH
ncbi:hypothetical protein ACMFMG_006669 [Clarireedia jacksonii]